MTENNIAYKTFTVEIFSYSRDGLCDSHLDVNTDHKVPNPFRMHVYHPSICEAAWTLNHNAVHLKLDTLGKRKQFQ